MARICFIAKNKLTYVKLVGLMETVMILNGKKKNRSTQCSKNVLSFYHADGR